MQITEYFEGVETVNGYRLMKIVSKILADLDPEAKELPGPMGYTYLKKGYVNGVKDVKSCTRDEAIKWTEAYLAKRYAVKTEEVPSEDPIAEANEIMEELEASE